MNADSAPVEFTPTELAAEKPKRPVWRSIRRGLSLRCPNCSRGKLMRRYLKVNDRCPACDEDLSHQRADDAPPYLTIVVVGHIIVPLILLVETRWPLPTLANLAIWLPLTAILSLTFLPLMKGAVVGLQWALRMHGFDGAGEGDEIDPLPDIVAEPPG